MLTEKRKVTEFEIQKGIADGVCADGVYHARKAVFCPEKDGAEREDIQMLQVPDDETKFPIGCLTGYQGG